MKFIPLTRGQSAKVDDSDFGYLNQWKWRAEKAPNTLRTLFYAVRATARPNRVTVRMHREILGLRDSKLFGEHKDGDGLNNTRENLRVATPSQNGAAFRNPVLNKSSRYRGVCYHIRRKLWYAAIKINGKTENLGKFSDEKAAAVAYDARATVLFGEFAQLNFPKSI